MFDELRPDNSLTREAAVRRLCSEGVSGHDAVSALIDAVKSLTEIRDRRAVEPILSLLTDSLKFTHPDDPGWLRDPFLREAILDALMVLGDERCVEPLIRLAKDWNYGARSMEALLSVAERTIGKMSRDLLNALAGFDDVAQDCVRFVERHDPDAMVPCGNEVGYGWFWTEQIHEPFSVDCSRIRQMALEERERRQSDS